MPALPASSSMCRCSNTSRTRPVPLREHNRPSNAVMMPAASCPRCCSTVSASYRRWLTGVVPTTPTMPHMFAPASFAPLARCRDRVSSVYFTLADHPAQHIRCSLGIGYKQRLMPPLLAIQTHGVTQDDKQSNHDQPAQQAEQCAKGTVETAEQRQAYEMRDDQAKRAADHQHCQEYQRPCDPGPHALACQRAAEMRFNKARVGPGDPDRNDPGHQRDHIAQEPEHQDG